MARQNQIRNTALALIFCAGTGLSQACAQSSTVTYAYDAVGRVISVYYPDGTCLAYTYDPAGNRSQYTSSTVVPPVANPVSISGYENLSSTVDPRVAAPICVTVTVNAVGTPSHGTASIVSGGTAVTYTPIAGYVGSDSFTYRVTNGTQTSGNGTITTTTQAPTLPPVTLPGLMSYLKYIIVPDKVVPVITLDVTPLSSSPYGYTTSISQVTQAAKGAITYSGNILAYTWNQGPIGSNKDVTDAFTYTVTDPIGHTATAAVSVSISVSTNQ